MPHLILGGPITGVVKASVARRKKRNQKTHAPYIIRRQSLTLFVPTGRVIFLKSYNGQIRAPDRSIVPRAWLCRQNSENR